MNIILSDSNTVTNNDIDMSFLNKFGNVTYKALIDYEDIADSIENADIILCNKTPLNAYTLRKAKSLKYIGLFATGYNNIDIEYCKNNNITVCNAGSYSTDAVAQQVFAFILEHYNKTVNYKKFVQDGGWRNCETFSPFVFNTYELRDKTIGLVGFGNIAKQVAKIATAFNMNVLAYTRSTQEFDNVTFTTLDELLSKSDIISVHCPLNEQSENMFNKETFSRCKKGSYFINTARGGIVVENDLVTAVKDGTLSGAGIDVLAVEPMDDDCPLVNVENITVTPHIAWAPLETRKRLMGIVASNIEMFLNGTPTNKIV